MLVVGLVAFAAVSGFVTTRAATGPGGLAFVDLARGADGDTLSPATVQYDLVPDPEAPGVQVDRKFRATGVVADPTPLPTPVAPPKVKTVTITKIVGNGLLLWPVPGAVITTYFSAAHPAIDMAIAAGSPVLAADAGTVTWAGWLDGGGGLQMWITHANGVETRYSHLSAALWVAGDVVTRGQEIGQVGCTGDCTGPHLHFHVLINGVSVNPLRYL